MKSIFYVIVTAKDANAFRDDRSLCPRREADIFFFFVILEIKAKRKALAQVLLMISLSWQTKENPATND